MRRVSGGSRLHGPARSLLVGAIAAAFAVPLSVQAAGAPIAGPTTVTGSWQAKLGSGGANGTAKIVTYLGGTGSVALKFTKLKPATLLPVGIYKGTCAAVGARVVALASIKTSGTGTASRTSALTATQTRSITTAGVGKMTIRVGSGTSLKCGVLSAQAITPYVAATITVGKHPHGVAVAPNGAWVTNWWDNSLSRIDPTTNSVLQTLPLTISGNGGPEAISYGENSLWITVTEWDTDGNAMPGSVIRVDPATGQQLATIPVGKGPFDIAFSTGAVWVSLYDASSVVRIDPANNTIAATVNMPVKPDGLAFGFGAVWVADDSGKLSRIDPATNQIATTIQTQDTGGYVAISADGVWIANEGHENTPDGMLTKVDPGTNSVTASVTVGSDPMEIAYADGYLWVGLYGGPTVVQVNAATSTIANRVTLPSKVYAIAAAAHSVWAVQNLQPADTNADVPAGQVIRIKY